MLRAISKTQIRTNHFKVLRTSTLQTAEFIHSARKPTDAKKSFIASANLRCAPTSPSRCLLKQGNLLRRFNWLLVLAGANAGFWGSLTDSFIGATLQYSGNYWFFALEFSWIEAKNIDENAASRVRVRSIAPRVDVLASYIESFDDATAYEWSTPFFDMFA